jgi:hypothetical protein
MISRPGSFASQGENALGLHIRNEAHLLLKLHYNVPDAPVLRGPDGSYPRLREQIGTRSLVPTAAATEMRGYLRHGRLAYVAHSEDPAFSFRVNVH